MKRQGLIAGLDEVGMGCLAGPIVVCTAAFPAGTPRMAGVKDSKQMTKAARIRLMPQIVEAATFVGLGYATVDMINRVGLGRAWQRAAAMSLEGMPVAGLLVVDGDRFVDGYRGQQLVQPKADITHWEVSAASVVAKVIRDCHMKDLARYYPAYRWDKNSGYGTQDHRDGLLAKGKTPHHRTKFIRKILG